MRNYAVRLGVEDAQVVEATLSRVGATGERSMQRIATATQPATQATRLFGASLGQLGRGQIQNAAFQLGDFAVQVGNGTRVSTALSQQLPQLLGAFGALGAVLGAGVAIGIPLVTAAMAAMGRETESLEDRLKALATSTDAVKAAQRDAELTAQQLIATYGAATAEVRSLIEAQATLARDNALRAAIDLISGSFADFSEEAQLFGRNAGAGFSGITSGAKALVRELDLSRDQAEALQAAILDARATEDLREQATALARIRGLLEEQRDEYGNLNPAAAEMYRSVLDTERQIRLATGAVDSLTTATDTSRQAAAGLEDAWGRVSRAAASAAASAAAARQDAEIRLRTAGDPIATAGALAGAGFDRRLDGLPGKGADDFSQVREQIVNDAREAARLQEQLAALNKAEPSARGGGGGRGSASRAVEERASAAERVIEGLQRELDMIGKTDLARRISTELRAAEVSALDGQGAKISELVTRLSELEEAQRRVDEVNDLVAESMSGLFGDLITGAASARDAIGQLVGELARMALTKGFTSLFGGLDVGGTGLGNALGSIFLPGFATGGSFRVGGGGGTDSQVVAFRATPGEMVDVRRPGQSGGGTVLNFAPTINAPGADREGLSRVRAELAAMRDSFRDQVAEATSNPWRRGAI